MDKKNDDSKKRIESYARLIKDATDKRKEVMSAAEVARKMDVPPTAVYRLERGANDVRISTLLKYLETFGFRLEIVKDDIEVVPNPKRNKKMPDIETLKTPSKRRERIRFLRYMLMIEEMELSREEDDSKGEDEN